MFCFFSLKFKEKEKEKNKENISICFICLTEMLQLFQGWKRWCDYRRNTLNDSHCFNSIREKHTQKNKTKKFTAIL